MTTRTMEFVLIAKNLLTGDFKAAEQDIGTLATKTKAAGTEAQATGGMFSGLSATSMLAGVGIALGVGAALLDFTHKAEEAQVADAKLDQAMKDHNLSSSEYAGQISAAAKANEQLGFTDVQTTNSLTDLIAAGHSVADSLNIQQAAMDLARLKSIPLQDATDALVKVEGGHYRMLQQLGITLPATATATEALAAVQKAAGGQAQAFAQTSAGAWDAFGAKMDHVEVQIGNALLPVLQGLGSFLSDDLMPAVQGVVDDVGNWIGQNQGLFDSLGVVANMVGGALGLAFQAIGQTIGSVVGIITGFIGALQNVAGFIGGVFQTVVDAAQGTTAPVYQATQATVDGMVKAANGGKDDVIAAADNMVSGIPAAATSASKSAVATVAKTPEQIAQALISGYSTITSASTELATLLKTPMSEAAREAQLNGELTDKNLVAGLKSNDPLIRAQALAMQADIENQLAALQKAATGYGKNTGDSYAGGLRASVPAIAYAAATMGGAVAAKLRADSPPVSTSPLHLIGVWGERTALAYRDGLLAEEAAVAAAAASLALAIKHKLEAFSPPGPDSPLHEIDTWGAKTAAAWGAGFSSQKDALARAVGDTLPGIGAGLPTSGASAGGGGASGGQLVVQLVLDDHGLRTLITSIEVDMARRAQKSGSSTVQRS